MTEQDQFRELIEAYALGALDEQERAGLEAHLANCEGCSKALAEARWLVSNLAYLAPPAAPSDMLKGRLLQKVRAESAVPAAPAKRSLRVPAWLWAGVAALLLVAFYSAWDAHQLQTEIARLDEQTKAAIEQNRELQKRLAMEEREARIMMDPRSKKIMLPAKSKDMPQLEAMWSPELGLCILGQKVPMPGNERGLQLWLIPKAPGSKPMPSHMLWPEADGKLVHVVENPPEPMDDTKAIAITEEPAGGSEQPTGTPMWMGGVS